MRPTIAIIDYGAGISLADRRVAAAALQLQVTRDFELHWFVEADVIAEDLAPSDCIICGLYASPDQPGVLGHHDVTDAGLPLMKCFPLADKADGIPWSVTVSHEILETLADPRCQRCVQVPDGRIAALEVADPVESDFYWIDGVAVSDFVLPAYFEPPRNGQGPFDMMGLVKYPLALRPGGYNQFWSPTAGWTTTMGEKRSARVASAKFGLTRGAQRRTREGRAA